MLIFNELADFQRTGVNLGVNQSGGVKYRLIESSVELPSCVFVPVGLNSRMATLLETFNARNDAGEETTLLIYQESIDVGTHDNPDDTIPGMKWVETAGGMRVNRIDANTFSVASTGEILRR